MVDETGDMIAAREAGIDVRAKAFTLNALMAGELDARVAVATAPMFKSVGGGMVLEKALAAGIATPLPISFENKKA